MSTSSIEAAEALTAIRASRARLAAAAEYPPERHLALGAMIGALVVTPALPIFYARAVMAGMLVCIALVILWDRRRMGMFISGYRTGRARPGITVAMLAVFPALGLSSFWLAQDRGLYWAPIPLGALAVVLGYYASILRQRAFRREMDATA